MDDDSMSAGLIYVAYGELMHKLQVMEMSLWEIQALQMKKGMTDAQAFAQVEKWDGTTFGALYRGMKSQPHWTEDLIWKVGQAVQLRNHLAHNFLREFFLAVESQANYEAGADQLLDWHGVVDELAGQLDEHIKTLGGGGWDQLDEASKAEVEALRPKAWPLNNDSEGSWRNTE
ncbi:hypothetical protein [Phycicoccus sp. Soil748]|uniref:hypothetical protein n=1 Tax=Phycicoccus sp. Soil748 TaxID=1736397 RepID=UPI000703A2C8|nr:hypothetical protein [Phycicoccus sp. Soil748]KRE56154.1 hypothetical protein ASG70_03050 [Phycicoccus sp. Soil748]